MSSYTWYEKCLGVSDHLEKVGSGPIVQSLSYLGEKLKSYSQDVEDFKLGSELSCVHLLIPEAR